MKMKQSIDNTIQLDNHVDDHVDLEIQECLSSVPPKSFFMFAGAGSGKTRSLISALEYLDETQGLSLAEYGKQVAVITYTNAACDEIGRRLQYKPIFHVSTIHSFLWELIKNFQTDIKDWVRASLQSEIEELQIKQGKGRGGDAAAKRAKQIAEKTERLQKINYIRRFSYNPNGENLSFDSLSHDEVIKIGSYFIESEPLMQQVLVSKYPFFLIDESQDTTKELIDALLCVYEKYSNNWVIGMFGDTMQRIYADGKDRLEEIVPKEWFFPIKVMNHRSAKRIVDLANAIRKSIDDKSQKARTDAKEGLIRLFIAQPNSDKEAIEHDVAARMYGLTLDSGWINDNEYESLILEHHMAASRYSFDNLFTPLDRCKELSTALRKGEIAELSFLAHVIAPLIDAYQANDSFTVAKILRKNCPLLSRTNFEKQPNDQKELLEQVDQSAESLFALWKEDAVPTCIDILKHIKESGLFDLGDRVDDLLDDEYTGDDTKVLALRSGLNASFDELVHYYAYVSDQTKFATHQGVKGLEFPRVMVVIDDSESRGFLFNYEKLFGAKQLSETDLKNEKEGKDTSNRRTARLFYVACTRAQDSLAVVVYSENPDAVKATAISNGWFLPDEIEIMN